MDNLGKTLAALYNHARPLGMGFLHYNPKPMTEAQGNDMLAARKSEFGRSATYFDYLAGRVMKIDVTNTDNVYLYERDNGPGSVMNALTCPGYRKCTGNGVPANEMR